MARRGVSVSSIKHRVFSVLKYYRVYQLALLEYGQDSASSTPQGVILALVGAEPPEGGSEKDNKEPHKVIRMYNLASLASITSWVTSGKVSPFLTLIE